VSAIDRNGRTIWIADAHRDGKRFIVRADEKLAAFVELESATSSCVEFVGEIMEPISTSAIGPHLTDKDLTPSRVIINEIVT